ncbi:MAG: CBS domain-containing protein [Methermicoccaceae archaeon]
MEISDVRIEEISEEAYTIDKSKTISEAFQLMEKLETRMLLVTRDEKIHGVATLRNIMRTLGKRSASVVVPSRLHITSAVTDNYMLSDGDMTLDEIRGVLSSGTEVVVHKGAEEKLYWVRPKNALEAYYNMDAVKGLASEAMVEPNPVSPKDRLIHARRLMIDKNIGRLPVVSDEGLIGIVTEHDIAKAMHAFKELVPPNQQENRIRMILVEDVMSSNVLAFESSTELKEVVGRLLQKHYSGAPITNGLGDVIGVLNRRTILGRL